MLWGGFNEVAILKRGRKKLPLFKKGRGGGQKVISCFDGGGGGTTYFTW